MGRVIITPEKIRSVGFEPISFVGKNKSNFFVWLVRCHCGKEFHAVVSYLVSGKTKSCGCLNGKKGDLSGERIGKLVVISAADPVWRSNRSRPRLQYMWNCLCDCGKTKVIGTSSLRTAQMGRRGGAYSCGCLNREAIAKAQKFGPEHHSWNPNIRPEDRNVKRRSAWSWSRSVFAKDNFTCLKCGKRGGELHAHHIYPYARFPDLRLEVENGATLCKPCHFLFHKIYGKQKSTAENYQEWIAQ